jgi:glycosyltransferase involved in cell wall biosynthesis
MRPDRPLVAVFDLVTSVGGVQQVMATLLPRLTDAYRVVVLDPYANPDYARAFERTGVETVALGPAPATRFIGGSGAGRVARLARRAPWLAATGLRLRRFAERRRPAAVWFNQLPSARLFSRFLPASGPAIVFHAHGFGRASDVADGPRLSRRCARIVAVSRAVADVLRRAGVEERRISVVHNAVDAAALRARARAGTAPLPPRAEGEVAVAVVGVVAPHKRQHVAIAALARLPPSVSLWLCGGVPEGGDPAYLEALRGLAARLGVERRVSFLGWRDDVPRVLDAADVALLTSGEESFGMALAEAMALGKPCVGSSVGGIPEVIEHGVTGWVADPAPGPVAAALGALAASAEARRAMGEAGRRRAERLFSVERQARDVREVLDVVAWRSGPDRRGAPLDLAVHGGHP